MKVGLELGEWVTLQNKEAKKNISKVDTLLVTRCTMTARSYAHF